MTTNRTYECNLCHVRLSDAGGGALGYGVYFKSKGVSSLELTTLREAENHICLKCIVDIDREFKALGAPQTEGESRD